MTAQKKYLLCPQCGARRLFIEESDGTRHYVCVLEDFSIVYTKTGEPIDSALDTSVLGCADCSWKGPVRKLVRYWTQ